MVLQTLCVYVADKIYSDASKRFAKDEDDEEDLPEAQVISKNLSFGEDLSGKSMDVRLPLFFVNHNLVRTPKLWIFRWDCWQGLLATFSSITCF